MQLCFISFALQWGFVADFCTWLPVASSFFLSHTHSPKPCLSYMNAHTFGGHKESLCVRGVGEIWITHFQVSQVSLNLLGCDLFSSFLNRIISCSQTWLCLSMNKALFCPQCRKPKQPWAQDRLVQCNIRTISTYPQLLQRTIENTSWITSPSFGPSNQENWLF